MTRFQDFPVTDRDYAWYGDAADKRLRRGAAADKWPSAKDSDARLVRRSEAGQLHGVQAPHRRRR